MRLLIFGLLPLVAVVTIAVVWVVGVWAIVSVYFYCRFDYTRQSWGISRMYRPQDREALYEHGWIDQAIFYALPVLGILYRSYQDPGKFLGLDLQVIPTAAVACGNSGRFDGGFARILDIAPHPSLVASAARCSAYALHGEPLCYLRRRLSHD